MTAASLPQRDGPHQLWLDVARPIQPRPRRRQERAADRGPAPAPPQQNQFELRMAAAPAEMPARTAFQVKAMADAPSPARAMQPRSFAAWLVDQGKQPGTLGELARAARLDRAFPKTGTADDVRARFSAAGADGDAFEALDDAERDYDRLA